MPIMPRAKYFQTLILNIFGICIGSAVALLGLWSSVQARINTTPTGSTKSYNSSQAAVWYYRIYFTLIISQSYPKKIFVKSISFQLKLTRYITNSFSAIWLFANIWFANCLRAKMPALQFPVIMYSIFTNIAFTYGPLFPTFALGQALIKQLLTGFLTAFGISTGVHLFIIPISSRMVVFKEQAGYIGLIRATLKAQTVYLESLESTDMFMGTGHNSDFSEETLVNKKKKNKMTNSGQPSASQNHPADTSQSKALKSAVAGLVELHGKLHGDIPFAKREIAWGKLGPKDMDEIFTLFRAITIPLIGMSTISDIFERIAERRGWVKPQRPNERDNSESWERCTGTERISEKKTWNEVMKALHEPFSIAVAVMDEGLEHAGLCLEVLAKPKKKKVDEEQAKGDPKPGDLDFSDHMEKKMMNFYGQRGKVLRAWAREKGLSEAQFDSASVPPPDCETYTPDEAKHRAYYSM